MCRHNNQKLSDLGFNSKVDYLLNVHKALGSFPSTEKSKNDNINIGKREETVFKVLVGAVVIHLA